MSQHLEIVNISERIRLPSALPPTLAVEVKSFIASDKNIARLTRERESMGRLSDNFKKNRSDILRQICRRFGLRVKIKNYQDSFTTFPGKCGNGHIIRPFYGGLIEGKYCKQCGVARTAYIKKLILLNEAFRTIRAKKHKHLKLLYGYLLNNRPFVRVKCLTKGCGRTFGKSAASIISGTGCKYCNGAIKLDEKDVIAELKAHDFIPTASFKYSGNSRAIAVKHNLKDCGYTWSPSLTNLRKAWRNGASGCSNCARNSKKTIQDARKIAKERRGRCLSPAINNSNQKLEWQCARNHNPWKTTLGAISAGSWCPDCTKKSYGEKISREYFELFTGKSFPAIWGQSDGLAWLKNKAGNFLELDGYCRELRLAFEHQGPHHEGATQKKKDKYKIAVCRENGVKVIEIPFIPRTLSIDSARDFIWNKLLKTNTRLYKSRKNHSLDFGKIYADDGFDDLLLAVTGKNGTVKEKGWLGYEHKYTFQCSESHSKWSALPGPILKGVWCPTCGRIDRRKALLARGYRQIIERTKKTKYRLVTTEVEYIDSRKRLGKKFYLTFTRKGSTKKIRVKMISYYGWVEKVRRDQLHHR